MGSRQGRKGRCRCRDRQGRSKRWHKDEIAVMLALADIERKDRPTAKERRWYRCPTTGGYHLTSQARRRAR